MVATTLTPARALPQPDSSFAGLAPMLVSACGYAWAPPAWRRADVARRAADRPAGLFRDGLFDRARAAWRAAHRSEQPLGRPRVAGRPSDPLGRRPHLLPARQRECVVTIMTSMTNSVKAGDDVWSLAGAKAHLSEVVDRAQSCGPQFITRRGQRAAVLVSHAEWLLKNERVGTLAEFFASSPLREAPDLVIERLPEGPQRPAL